MRRIPLAAIATTLALAGCPLPQPLPTYPAGTVTPPRILAASTTSSTTSGVQSIIPVPAGCATAPTYTLVAKIFYQESVAVEARWFVDYRTDVQQRNTIVLGGEVPPDPNPLVLERQVPTLTFGPYGFAPPGELGLNAAGPPYGAAGIVHVVELVVSNGFDDSTSAPEPNRTPGSTADGTSKFEIQTYRWTFVNVPAAASCAPDKIGCVTCPP